MTNEELAALAKTGDAAAKEQLFINNQRYSHYVARQFCKQNDQRYEDFVGIANLGMVKAYNAYEPARGYKFLTFATLCMRNEILLSLRRDRKYKPTVSLEATVHMDYQGNDIKLADVIGDGLDFTQSLLNARDINRVYEHIKTLNPIFKTVAIEHLINDKTQCEVAEMVGLSKSYNSRISRKVQQIFRYHRDLALKIKTGGEFIEY